MFLAQNIIEVTLEILWLNKILTLSYSSFKSFSHHFQNSDDCKFQYPFHFKFFLLDIPDLLFWFWISKFQNLYFFWVYFQTLHYFRHFKQIPTQKILHISKKKQQNNNKTTTTLLHSYGKTDFLLKEKFRLTQKINFSRSKKFS